MPEPGGNPNIIYIMADDMGYGDPGCFGATRIRTPNIDRVASGGMAFTDAHSSSAVCTPSRYSVLTGRYCWRTRLDHGVLGGFGKPLLEPDRPTVASLLRDNGYRCAAVGKWHLGLGWTRKNGAPPDDFIAWEEDGFDIDYRKPLWDGPLDHGFDYFFGIAGSLDMPPYCFIENDLPYAEPRVEKNPYNPQQRRGLMSEGWRDDQVDVEFASRAVSFIEAHQRNHRGEPFFLYLAPSAPHRPCVPPSFIHGSSEAGLRGDAVVLVDWMVGQILETLERLNLTDSTLLMVTSDNGARLTNFDGKDYGHKSNGDLRGGKGDIWDGGHREPLVAMWPEVIAPGSRSGSLVCLSDLMATCADIVGARLPARDAKDTISLLPVLRGDPEAAPRESVVHHSQDGMFSVRRGPWKLIDGLGSGGYFSEPTRWTPGPGDPHGQLYHMENDTRENLNLWKSEPRIVEELRGLLATYREQE